MTNRLIAARDRFAASHPEQRIAIGGREWGYVRVGDSGPALLGQVVHDDCPRRGAPGLGRDAAALRGQRPAVTVGDSTTT